MNIFIMEDNEITYIGNYSMLKEFVILFKLLGGNKMAGYVIHLAIAEEYLRKHKDTKEDYEEFIKGVIYPDSVTDKSLTHYGIKSSKVILKDFLQDNEINNSYMRGYFLHLITDYLFYNKYLEKFSKDIYNDYDILNKRLIEKYNVVLPVNIQNNVFYKEGETKILTMELAIKIIDEISDLNLNAVEKEIRENSNDEKWSKINWDI